MRVALGAWSALAGITFVEVQDTSGSVGDIRFGESTRVPTAQAYNPGGSPASGDVWLGPDFSARAATRPAATNMSR